MRGMLVCDNALSISPPCSVRVTCSQHPLLGRVKTLIPRARRLLLEDNSTPKPGRETPESVYQGLI